MANLFSSHNAFMTTSPSADPQSEGQSRAVVRRIVRRGAVVLIDRALAALERSPWIGGSAAVMLAALAYAHSIGLGFAYDDVPIIRDNLLLHSLADWRTILGATWWPDALYRPFTSLTLRPRLGAVRR